MITSEWWRVGLSRPLSPPGLSLPHSVNQLFNPRAMPEIDKLLQEMFFFALSFPKSEDFWEVLKESDQRFKNCGSFQVFLPLYLKYVNFFQVFFAFNIRLYTIVLVPLLCSTKPKLPKSISFQSWVCCKYQMLFTSGTTIGIKNFVDRHFIWFFKNSVVAWTARPKKVWKQGEGELVK